MTEKNDPGALAGATGDNGDQRDETDQPLPWLANLPPAEYESMRRWFARQYGWRVATLDRLYREARHKAGAPR